MRKLTFFGSGFLPFALCLLPFFNSLFSQNLIVRSPVAGQPIALPGGLSPVLLSARLENFFLFDQVKFIIDGQTLQAINHKNGAFTAYYTPSSFGAKTVEVISNQIGGVSETISVPFELIAAAPGDVAVPIFQEWQTNKDIPRIDTLIALPSHVGAFKKIMLFVSADCATTACAPFSDPVSIKINTPEGDPIEIVRYMTPMGLDCNFQVEVTDFFWALQGRATFSIEHKTTEGGLLWTALLLFIDGPTAAKYGQIEPIWQGNYLFGDLAKLQPVEEKAVSLPVFSGSAKLKMTVTGHASGANNTGNAAEFFRATHGVWVDGVKKFDHNVWQKCVPNLEGCLPQNGNWAADRAGWCPGMWVRGNDFDLADLVGAGEKRLRYRFDESFQDLCSASNPACVSGVTCGWCADPGAPNLEISSALVLASDGPLGPLEVKTVAAGEPFSAFDFELKPNPTDGNLLVSLPFSIKTGQIDIFSASGQKMKSRSLEPFSNPTEIALEVADLPPGLYFLSFRSAAGAAARRFLKI